MRLRAQGQHLKTQTPSAYSATGDSGKRLATGTERLISLSRAAKYFPRTRRGKKPHRATIYRYTTTGRDGVVLESVQAGFVRCTTKEAVARFFEALTKAKGLRSPSSSNANAVAEAEAAGQRLAATVFAKQRRRERKEE